MTTTTADALDIRSLSVTFDGGRRNHSGHMALSDVTLNLARGSALAIVGESGSGKTTLLRVALRLQRDGVSGRVALLGRDLENCGDEDLISLRRRCGYVCQDPYGGLPPTLSAIDAATEPWTVVHGRRSAPEARERARSILASLGIEGDELLNSRVRLHLSGGQRQRVAVARALILEPELLLCDEPTSMQDASTRMDVVKVLLRAVKNGAAMVFVTHDLALASRVADRVVVLRRGRVVETGNAREVLSSPRAEYTKQLVDALPRLERSEHAHCVVR
jgi:peptide/nickel transport system ATP-binding protein